MHCIGTVTRVALNGVLDNGFIEYFNTQLHLIIAPSVISILYSSLQHTLYLFQSTVSSLVVAWYRLLTMAILLLPCSRPLLTAAPFQLNYSSESHVRADGRSVSRPDIDYVLKVTFLSIGGALSDEKSVCHWTILAPVVLLITPLHTNHRRKLHFNRTSVVTRGLLLR
jgi:hypothetical protein